MSLVAEIIPLRMDKRTFLVNGIYIFITSSANFNFMPIKTKLFSD